MRYDCLPARGTQYLISGLGMEKGERPHHVLSCVVLHARTKLLAWSGLWSKHDVHAAALSDEVESEVQASADPVRVQMRESSSNTYWDILLYFYMVAFKSYI